MRKLIIGLVICLSLITPVFALEDAPVESSSESASETVVETVPENNGETEPEQEVILQVSEVEEPLSSLDDIQMLLMYICGVLFFWTVVCIIYGLYRFFNMFFIF